MDVPKHIPAKVQSFLSEQASRYPTIERVLIFGSRARGDARERSDFDLAVVASEMTHSTWSRFALEVEDKIPTLCEVDLLLINDSISRPLRTKIEQEGVVIYERAA